MKCIASTFLLPKLKTNVSTFIRNCTTCLIKTPAHKPYGLLQPLPIPSLAWQDISMDFITHLPVSTLVSVGKTTIWVVVERFSKCTYFIALPTTFGAVTLATLFLSNIYQLHGLPRSIVFDRDPIFLSSFLKKKSSNKWALTAVIQ